MAIHDVKLLAKEEVARGTLALHFGKPAGFAFKAGQAVDLVLADGSAEGARHAFSIVSAPFEGELVLATRMRDSAYKHLLAAMRPGSMARIDGPFGSLTLHKDMTRAAVFVAGGIGITPFMSMLRQGARDAAERDFLLLYSSRRPEDAAFLAELQEMRVANPRFRLVATMTDTAGSAGSWAGETRLVAEPLLREAATGLARPLYYVAGPPAMVEAVRASLERAGVDDADVRSEEFHGYEAAVAAAAG